MASSDDQSQWISLSMSSTSRSGCWLLSPIAGREARELASMTCMLRDCNPRAISRRNEISASIRRTIGFFSEDMLAPLCYLSFSILERIELTIAPSAFLGEQYMCHPKASSRNALNTKVNTLQQPERFYCLIYNFASLYPTSGMVKIYLGWRESASTLRRKRLM